MSERQYSDDETDLRDYIKVMIKRKKIILAIFLICVATTTVISFLTPKVYEATTTISISIPIDIPIPIGTPMPLISKEEVVQKLKTEKVLKPIIQTLNLNIDEFTLEKMISIENIKNTNFLRLKIQYSNPQLSVKICDAIADYFIQQCNESRDKKILLIKEEINKLEKRSKIVEEEMQKFGPMLPSQTSNSDFVMLQNALSNYETTFLNLSGRIYSLKQALMDYTKFEVFKSTTMSQNVKPNKRLNITVSAILGLMVGIFAAFLQDFWQKGKN